MWKRSLPQKAAAEAKEQRLAAKGDEYEQAEMLELKPYVERAEKLLPE